jgi:hypothetical protein
MTTGTYIINGNEIIERDTGKVLGSCIDMKIARQLIPAPEMAEILQYIVLNETISEEIKEKIRYQLSRAKIYI